MDNGVTDRLMWAAISASCATYGIYACRGLKTPLPGEDQDVALGLDSEIHEVTTEDGALLRLKRYASPGGTPILFCHGFNGNGFEFDLPRKGHNMAEFFARKGYDVWVSSFRGCGREPCRGDAGGWKHSIDHLAVYDAPSLVEMVSAETGRKPFWIGHSMGGMVLYMYLQGVRFEDGGIVVSDPDLVEERNRHKLAGGIPIASPPAFWWPRLHPFQVVTESTLGRGALGASVVFMRLRDRVYPRVTTGSTILRAFGNHPRAIKAISRSPLGLLLYCRRNTDPEASTSLVRWGADDVSARMFIQLVDGIWNTNFRQYFPVSFREQPYDYTMNMDLITLPMLFVTGDKDFANWAGIKRFGYDRISSDRKRFVKFPGYGHTDLVMGRNVEEEVYPFILDWIEEIEKEESLEDVTGAPA